MPVAELQVPEVTSTQTEVVSLETPLEEPVTVNWYPPAVVLAVVVAVIVAVCASVLLLVKSSDEDERLQLAGLVAFEGDEVSAQASVTVPVNELDGVTVMVAVLPEVAPGVTVMGPLLVSEKEPVPLPPVGACQKSPHPARSGATASRNLAQLPIFIAAPCFLAR